ncbi:DUF6199 family natural product biosynthesis protein [Paenibacillus sp. PvP091]
MGVFLIFAGVLMIFKTSVFWEITERWTSRDGTEPSDLYIWNTRFGGIMCILAGLAGILIYVIL